MTPSSNASGDFRLETKPVLLQMWNKIDDYLPPKYFVAGFHIGEVQVGEPVRKHRQEAIADIVPVVQHSVSLVTQKTAAVNHVGTIFDNRSQ